METCKYGSGAGKRKPTAVKRKGVVCRAYTKMKVQMFGTGTKRHGSPITMPTWYLIGHKKTGVPSS